MRTALLLLLSGFALAACGVNGPPQPPRPDSFPHQYPAAEPLPKPQTPPAPAANTTNQPTSQ
jgi:hypothetical protein